MKQNGMEWNRKEKNIKGRQRRIEDTERSILNRLISENLDVMELKRLHTESKPPLCAIFVLCQGKQKGSNTK